MVNQPALPPVQPLPPRIPAPFAGAEARKNEIEQRLNELMRRQQELIDTPTELPTSGQPVFTEGPTPEEQAASRVGELDELSLVTRMQLAVRSISPVTLPRSGVPILDAVILPLRAADIQPPEFLLEQARKEAALRNSLLEIVTEVDQLTWRLQTLEMLPAAIEGVLDPSDIQAERILQVETVEDFIRIYMEPGSVVSRNDLQWAARVINQIQEEKRVQAIPPLSAEERSKHPK